MRKFSTYYSDQCLIITRLILIVTKDKYFQFVISFVHDELLHTYLFVVSLLPCLEMLAPDNFSIRGTIH